MRKYSILLLAAFLALIAVHAGAAELPAVTLSIADDTVNGGLPVSVVVAADEPMAADTEIQLSDSEGGVYTAVIKSGQTEVTIACDTPVVTRRTPMAFTAAGCNAAAEVMLYPLPEIEFYEAIYIRFTDRDCAVAVTMDKNNLLQDGEFTLCDQYGETLATLTIRQNTTRSLFNFKWTPDASQVGRHDLTIRWNGFTVSADMGYLAIADIKNLAVYSYPVTEKFIALSLDCAYQWAYIDDFLEMLDRQNVKVTFFMTGSGVKEHPEDVLKLQAHGHELANHSYSHYHMTELEDLHVIRREITKTNNAIEELTGVHPTKFRPPFGEYNRYVAALSIADGCDVIMWTNDAMDWVDGATVSSIYHHIIRNPAPGNIILAHILNKDTVEAMDMAITYFKEQGYRLGTVSDLEAIYLQETGEDKNQ
ncbi:MAG TPA: polysaccharide deacetylase family protein [Candidatus Limiplasma sp.]|nr:polysaccharide deacetylase family protein [Candidatus Limiplasma sp.]